jgi:hypothetical protein
VLGRGPYALRSILMRGAQRLAMGQWKHDPCERCSEVRAAIEIEPDHRWYLRTRYCDSLNGDVVDFAIHLGTNGSPVDSVIRVSVAHRNHHVRMYIVGSVEVRVETIALIERHSDMLTAFAWSAYRLQPYHDQWINAWKDNTWASVALR